MTRAQVHRCTGALVLACSGALLAMPHQQATTQQQATPQQPVFRANADLVTVPVSVRASGTPVAGLKPEDFVVLDNGVPQKVESLDGESVAADITILVETGQPMKPYLGTLSEQVKRISAMVRPTDRLEVLGIDTYIEELLPLRLASEQPPLGRLKAGGSLISVNDALVAALLREPDKQRPHLVIAITDTVDSISTADMKTVRDVAKESGATLVIAWVTMSIDAGGGLDPVTKMPMWFTTSEREKAATGHMITAGNGPAIGNGRSMERARYWIPHYDPPAGRSIDKFDLLKEAAETTGGALHPPGVFTDRSAAAIFKKVFDDYRHSYILRYSAEGVSRSGWHEITVTTPKFPSYELHARKGYLVEPPSTPVNRNALPRGSLQALIAAQEADDDAGIDRTIRENWTGADLLKLLNDFKTGGNAFPGAPRKEFLLALKLAETSLPLSYPAARSAAYDLLTRYSRLVRQVSGEDEFEKDWMAAAIALAEAPLRPNDAQRVLDIALKRFPDEPRFVLARAILADQLGQAKPSPAALAIYDAAIANASTRDEARVRKARLLSRLGRSQEALALVDAANAIQNDIVLRFWRELIRAKILDDLGQTADAVGAFRAALDIAPEAQSARMGLMTALARDGRTVDAKVIAEAIQTARPDADDPWWGYWQADYRFFPGLVARMKGRVK